MLAAAGCFFFHTNYIQGQAHRNNIQVLDARKNIYDLIEICIFICCFSTMQYGKIISLLSQNCIYIKQNTTQVMKHEQYWSAFDQTKANIFCFLMMLIIKTFPAWHLIYGKIDDSTNPVKAKLSVRPLISFHSHVGNIHDYFQR